MRVCICELTWRMAGQTPSPFLPSFLPSTPFGEGSKCMWVDVSTMRPFFLFFYSCCSCSSLTRSLYVMQGLTTNKSNKKNPFALPPLFLSAYHSGGPTLPLPNSSNGTLPWSRTTEQEG